MPPTLNDPREGARNRTRIFQICTFVEHVRRDFSIQVLSREWSFNCGVILPALALTALFRSCMLHETE